MHDEQQNHGRFIMQAFMVKKEEAARSSDTWDTFSGEFRFAMTKYHNYCPVFPFGAFQLFHHTVLVMLAGHDRTDEHFKP